MFLRPVIGTRPSPKSSNTRPCSADTTKNIVESTGLTNADVMILGHACADIEGIRWWMTLVRMQVQAQLQVWVWGGCCGDNSYQKT